jgi:(2Fe-2S) ferredoxin
LDRRGLQADIKAVGCIGQCVKEPLVDIALPGESRVTYANVNPNMVSRLIEEQLVNGRVTPEWALGRLEVK